ncbi:MAG TPA: pentapeptide repeat-containing protein, partial [Dongiaceae bacterium]
GSDFRDGMLLVSVNGEAKPAEHEADPVGNRRIGMARANLEGARLRSALAQKADLSGANLRNADLSNADLSDASLKDADLRGSNLSGCNLTGARLNRANIEGAKLDGARLKDANIHGVAIAKALSKNLDISEAISVDDSAEAARGMHDRLAAHELWVSSNGDKGERADFSETDLSGVDFSHRNLSAAVFLGARLRSTVFSRAIIELADFTRADLTAADFSRANLRGCNFTDAILHRASFRNADLRVQVANLPNGMTKEFPVTLVGCRFGETNFTGVEFDRVNAGKLKLQGVIADQEFRSLLVPA